jgi:hypothetical protein
MKLQAALLLGALAAGCGQGVADINEIGDGNEVLFVTASASFDDNDNETNVQVDVFRDGNRLDDTNSQVQIGIGEDGALQDLQFQGNAFRIDLPGYTRELHLVVLSGGDNVEAVLEGPDATFIEEPVAGQVINISEGEDLRVEWDSEDNDNATEVRVSTQGFNTTLIGDPGDFTIPFVNVNFDADTVFVERTNIALLDGGAPGSTFSISTEVEVNFVVQ